MTSRFNYIYTVLIHQTLAGGFGGLFRRGSKHLYGYYRKKDCEYLPQHMARQPPSQFGPDKNTWQGTDHTREHIPVLAFGAGVTAGPLGKRESFADIGQSLASFFDLPAMDYGKSFLNE